MPFEKSKPECLWRFEVDEIGDSGDNHGHIGEHLREDEVKDKGNFEDMEERERQFVRDKKLM